MVNSVNKIIKTLILTDFFLYSAYGFIMPIFAIFIVQRIAIDNPEYAIKVAGISYFLYWGVKSLLQIPISKYLDKIHGEKDDFWFMVLGLFISSLIPFGFIFSSSVWHIYLLQVLHALGMALFIPAWNAIFTRHMDKGKEAFEWALDSTCLGLGTAVTGAVGGFIVAVAGFHFLFVFSGIINLLAAFAVLLVYKKILPKDHMFSWFPRPRPF